MSSQEKNDGGPAFPVEYLDKELMYSLRPEHGTIRAKTEATIKAPGMSLRDWFAGMALAGMGERQPFAYHDANVPMAKAQYAYAMADAMLEARGV